MSGRRLPGAATARLLLLAVLGGCGYSTGSLVPPEHRRVALPLFGNETFYRDLEVELTRQVARELASRPGFFIVPPEEADIVLAGTILDFQPRVLAEDDRDRTRESSATTQVRMEVRNARTGRVQASYVVTDRAEFNLLRGESLATATDESFFDLARKLVQRLEEGFPPARPAHAEANPEEAD